MTGQPSGIDDATSIVSAGPKRRSLTRSQKIGVAALVLAVTLGFIWLRQLSRQAEKTQAKATEAAFGTGEQLRSAPLAEPPPLPMPTQALPALIALPAEQPQGETAAGSPILAYAGSAAEHPAAASASSPAAAPTTPSAEQTESSSPLAARLRPTVLEPTKARLLPHPDFLLTKGTIIPCILQTAIDTTLAGFVKCVTPASIRSTTGNVVLLDKGTIIIGEIERGLQNGENRVFVLWNRAETPGHAIVTLDSPGTDELGRSGLPGAVDTHFWQRFGSAIMLSVLQGGLQAGSSLASSSNSGTSVELQSFQSNGQELANTALANSINIPPTLAKNQGDTVAVFVARDLDFSDIYALRLRPTETAHAE